MAEAAFSVKPLDARVVEPRADGEVAFSFHARKGGVVAIARAGRIVTVLRGTDAQRFLAKGEPAPFEEWQQRVALATGYYRRGNERLAGTPAPDHGTNDA